MANSVSLCGILVEAKDVRTSMANNSLAFAVATALGPVLGGIIVEYLGWEYCFFINIIIGALSFVLCWVYLPAVPKFKEDMLDWFGCIIILVGLICLVLGFTFLPPDKNNLVLGITMTIGGILIITAFIFWERWHPFAIIPHGILKEKKIMLTLCAGLLNFAMMTTISW